MPQQPKAPGLQMGVTEAMIRKLVHVFYANVRRDAVLGPIFEKEIHDWDAHLGKLCAFWSSVALMTGRYKGKPVPAHLKLAGIGAAHFKVWLELFARTAHEVCPPDAARLFIDRSERIGESLQLAIAIHQGVGPEAHNGAG